MPSVQMHPRRDTKHIKLDLLRNIPSTPKLFDQVPYCRSMADASLERLEVD